ncbi:hypothetical protein TNIN_220971 [Trichonephila inaurata madagascariensis]|uniref:Uncharacterized protein n=1 Tax=Trichonephila inaurata madagascariensis TaxID=2747483 RepID=A0A8X6MI04_9ARAC|nr:hypothetical protein TNIN_220971 [Trichonephila inaurata madagascariensis]
MRWDFELQKKRFELKGEGNKNEVKEPGQLKIDLHKSIPKFDSKSDINLFLISFEPDIRMICKNSEFAKNMLGDTSDQHSTFGYCS